MADRRPVTGTPDIRPLDPNDPDVRKLALIDLALARGMPWAAVAKALGVQSKTQAKKVRADLERRVKAKQLAPAGPQPVIGGGCDDASHDDHC